MNIIKSIFRDNMFRHEDLGPFVSKFYFEGKRRKQYLVRFGVLTILSTIIATYGVLADSVATVIGAMIIAPLMMPIMAMATALVMGRMDRAAKSFLTVTVGSLSVIFVAMFLANTYFGFISLETNSQIFSRVSPNIADLFVALASGAVAAFAMSRDDINDSLPGVAIAIALVPPLAVTGICLSVGNMVMVGGAFLLFLTNFLSILVAGSIVFHLLGLSKVITRRLDGKALRNSFIAIGIGLLLVIVPLVITSTRTVTTAMLQDESQSLVEEWLADSEYKLIKLKITNHKVEIIVSGEGELTDFNVLTQALIELNNDSSLIVELNAVQSKYISYPENFIEPVNVHN